MKKRPVAVFFGGRSPEHDVSIATGLHVLNGLRTDRYQGIPVYVSLTGDWFVGEQLRDQTFYIPSAEDQRRLTNVHLSRASEGHSILSSQHKRLWTSAAIQFEIAIPAFHGAIGEDGCFQGIMEEAGIPYTGMRVLGSAIAMDKTATKALVHDRTSVPQLPFMTVNKPSQRHALSFNLPSDWNYPVIVKPANLGSSIGVACATSNEEVESNLRDIFVLDSKALLEPYLEHKREYNIAARRIGTGVQTSAIEMPISNAQFLDFTEKYIREGGLKTASANREAVLLRTRQINPSMDATMETNIRRWATEIFEALDGTGAPRLDFLMNEDTGETWFSEINPCPGFFAYNLWEGSAHRVLFSELLDGLLDEAIVTKSSTEAQIDPVPIGARLFPRN